MPSRTPGPPYAVERGSGRPVLAVHGWAPDHRLMLGCLEPVFARIPGYRRLYPDLPGMGRTPADESITSSDDLLATIERYVEETVADERLLVVGESYGGYLARALANRRADQVCGLALIAPIGTRLAASARTVPHRRVLRPDPELLASADPHLAAMFGGLSVVQNARVLERFREEVLPGLDAADQEAMARIARRWALAEPPEGEIPFTRPTLIITGRQDDAVGYLDQFALLDHYPRATFAALDLAGHNLQIERQALFEALVLDWLDRVETEPVG